MPLPTNLLPTTCDIFRPFGAGAATTSGVPCRLVADFRASRMSADAIDWTHYLVLDSTVDIRDGCSRLLGSNALGYADGDEVRVPTLASSPRFVVVWVETVDYDTDREYKRAYLMRHTA